MNQTATILITGAAGFIGFHTALRLLEQGHYIVGIDNLNDYYDITLKQARLNELAKHKNFTFIKTDIADKSALETLWQDKGPFTQVIHLAAQAGVRYSIENPYSYITSNCMGHLTILEMCRNTENFQHLVYASSSSVYGKNTKLPNAPEDPVNRPISLYAATKRADELMSHTYSHLYQIPQTGLRFFTVYGPWGRPDMAPMIFTKAILAGNPINVFNQGDMKRDFTYIDDIIDGILATLKTPPTVAEPTPHHRILNLGNNRSENLTDFIKTLENAIGKTATINPMPMQDGDVKETYADISETTALLGYKPTTTINQGIPRFINWYKSYYGHNA